MTKELVKKILDAYKKALEELPSVKDKKEFLTQNFMELGVCAYARRRYFNQSFYTSEAVNNLKSFRNWWALSPIECETDEEIISSMETRIAKLEKLLENVSSENISSDR